MDEMLIPQRAELPGDLRQDAGTVHDHKPKIVQANDLFHGLHTKRSSLILLEGRCRHPPYAPDRTLRPMAITSLTTALPVGKRSGPLAIHDHIPNGVADELNGVIDSFDLRDRRDRRKHRRMHARFNVAVDQLGNAEQLDGESKFLGIRDIGRRDDA